MKKLLSFDNGLSLVMKNLPRQMTESCPLDIALGRVLAASVNSPSVSPPFDQSAMDGYAFRFQDLKPGKALEIQEMIPAGKTKKVQVKRNCCARIFTGAPMPAGADTVVMQEKVSVVNGLLQILDTQLHKGSNVRYKASHIRNKQQLAQKGQRLTAPLIAYLASAGVRVVQVLSKPAVGIVVTGDELVKPGENIKHGQVYECNTPALVAALHSVLPAVSITTYRVKDDAAETGKTIDKALRKNQCVLITGGVSVGDFDFVIPSLKKLDVKLVFHKLLQKPGKPVCFGRKADKLVFGLPGNPASVLSCFYTLVLPALSRLYGARPAVYVSLPLQNDFSRKPGLTQFLKATVLNDQVSILSDQESYKLNSFAAANALVKILPPVAAIPKGDQVDVLLLPL